jgi:hypothetical protein
VDNVHAAAADAGACSLEECGVLSVAYRAGRADMADDAHTNNEVAVFGAGGRVEVVQSLLHVSGELGRDVLASDAKRDVPDVERG